MQKSSCFCVAPHAGAWIETPPANLRRLFKLSRLTQARGLKPLKSLRPDIDWVVAPHAGAWIETTPARIAARFGMSRASRRRVD